jgi:DNA-binding transcriptional LysR family regulator
METNQVRYFLALCEEQSFTRAAKRCGVSQPSVSNAIKRLEEELGGDLFHRTKNGAKLSPLGVAIRPYLDQINDCAEGARRDAAYFSTADMAQSRRERRSGANFFTVQRFRLVLFLSEYYSLTSPTPRRHRAPWRIQSWT